MLTVLAEFGYTLPEAMAVSLKNLQNKLENNFWTKNVKVVVQDFTFHDLEHSKGVMRKILTVVKNAPFVLSHEQLYVLAASSLLHDTGMNINIEKRSEVLQKAIGAYGAQQAPSPPFSVNNIIQKPAQKYVRDIHHCLSAALCHDYISDIIPASFGTIVDCCLYHRGKKVEDIYKYVNTSDVQVKSEQVLVALFRLGDELDIGIERISLYLKDAEMREPLSESYWELNARERITIGDDNDITLHLYINKNDGRKQGIQDLVKATITEFYNKNQMLLSLLCKLGIRVSFNCVDSGVIVTDYLTYQNRFGVTEQYKLPDCDTVFIDFLKNETQKESTYLTEIEKNKLELYRKNLEDGAEIFQNNVAIVFLPELEKYVFFFHKKIKLLQNKGGFRGQILCAKHKIRQNDTDLYRGVTFHLAPQNGSTGNETSVSTNFEAYVRINGSEYKKALCERIAHGAGFLSWIIHYRKFRYPHAWFDVRQGVELDIVYKYEVPVKYWGNYLRRTISCFYEQAHIDLIIHAENEHLLKKADFTLYKAIEDAGSEGLIDLTNPHDLKEIDFKNTIFFENKDAKWDVAYKFSEGTVKCFRIELPIDDLKKTNYKELYKFELTWESDVIFPGDKQTTGSETSQTGK